MAPPLAQEAETDESDAENRERGGLGDDGCSDDSHSLHDVASGVGSRLFETVKCSDLDRRTSRSQAAVERHLKDVIQTRCLSTMMAGSEVEKLQAVTGV